jgi:predicted phage-related endonuclease
MKGVAMSNVFAALQPPRPKLKLVPASEPDASALEDAASGIEASEAAASSETKTWTETSAQYWRALLEPLVASVYTKRSGNTLRRVNLLTRHPAYPWMQARVDWEVLGCPNVDLLRYLSVGKQDAPAWEQGLPVHERLNALHLLAVTGKQAVDLAVLVCGQELQIHRVARDEPVIARLVLLESRFWRCVELNQSPALPGDTPVLKTEGAYA